MRVKTVLFIIPNLHWENAHPSYPHLGIGYLAEILGQHDINSTVLDMTLGYTFSNLVHKIREINPDIIGLTLYSYRYLRAYELIGKIKRMNDAPIVIGGPHVSLMGKKCLKESVADFAIKYEGENPLLELCLGVALNEIQNLIYRDGGEIKENTNRPFIANLDSLHFPKYSSFELKKYDKKSINIITSRGCPFHCTYCTVKTTMGRNFRVRSPENVISELKYWYSIGYRDFQINDDVFNADVNRVYKICDLIKKDKMANVGFSAWQGMRLDKVDRPFLEKLKSVGFYSLAFGVESYNSHVLQSMKKGETKEQIDEGVRIACELGFFVTLFFILGFPGETWQDIKNSVKFSLKYPIGAAGFFNLIPYPGTELFDTLQADHLILADPNIYLNDNVNSNNRNILFQPKSLSMAERRKVIKLGECMSRKVSQKHLERKLSKFGFFGGVFAWFIYSKFVKQSWLYLDRYRVIHRGGRIIVDLIRIHEIR
jgi:radical SAM superfamily enzyme YgiQ (UPF0313 family)